MSFLSGAVGKVLHDAVKGLLVASGKDARDYWDVATVIRTIFKETGRKRETFIPKLRNAMISQNIALDDATAERIFTILSTEDVAMGWSNISRIFGEVAGSRIARAVTVDSAIEAGIGVGMPSYIGPLFAFGRNLGGGIGLNRDYWGLTAKFMNMATTRANSWGGVFRNVGIKNARNFSQDVNILTNTAFAVADLPMPFGVGATSYYSNRILNYGLANLNLKDNSMGLGLAQHNIQQRRRGLK